VAASIHRPPGHHAERARAMGFCLFNNVAIAARRAIDAHGLSRVLILDWDVHHGNGTNDIFEADPQVLFVSIHQWPLYPGTGAASDIGSGAGEGYTVNLPVPGGSGDALWCSLVEHVVLPLAGDYAPELVLVSAGYDAHADDPLAGCTVSDEGYATMAGSVRRLTESLGVPLGMILEGGYDLGALARCVGRTLDVFGGSSAPAAVDLPVHPGAVEAAARLAARWPALA
jgi:acetoin utilization deacetylase AcuC-like enzyme